jgi:uncharacterized protein YjbJ (UPF0337 family)
MDKDTVQGKTEKTIGHAKEAAGDLIGDNELQASGAKDQAIGQFHETVGAFKQLGRDIASGVNDGVESAKHDPQS